MREAQAETKTANRVEIVCFTVEDQDFSIEISHVLEIRGGPAPRRCLMRRISWSE